MIFKHCFPVGNKKWKDLWQIKFAEDNLADKIHDCFRPFRGIQVSQGLITVLHRKRKEMFLLVATSFSDLVAIFWLLSKGIRGNQVS